MLFNSYIFIFLFLPLCVVGYFGINRISQHWGQAFLVLMSLWFYGYYNIKYLPVIAISIAGNYLIYLLMKRKQQNKKIKLFCLYIGIILNIGVLFYFKYFDFFLKNVNHLFKTEYVLRNIALPIGISFFTFQQIAFLVDTYKNEVEECDLLSYASFVTFFPQLIAGPIVSHNEILSQFRDVSKKNLNWENFSRGIYIFILGLAKKVLLADTFGNVANWGFASIEILDTTNAIITMLAYTFQLYFDFSGYCDMAVGIGKMLNIDLPINFDSPYKALTIAEFWKRWHITMTRFFTKYVYIPMGGSRKGKIRTCINVLVVFSLSGLWHGANWTFVFWGMVHGIFMVIYRVFKGVFDKLHPALNWIITFTFVNIAWVLFRVDSVENAVRFLNRIALLRFGEINSTITGYFNLPEFLFIFGDIFNIFENYSNIMVGAFFIMAFGIILGGKSAHEKMLEFKPTGKRLLWSTCLLVWCIFSLTGKSIFLYFNF